MDSGSPRQIVPEGDSDRGRDLLDAYGCDACHTIPGVAGAIATVGPPLDDWPQRAYIAGALINTPENLIQWIREPQEIEPGTVMPDLGVSQEEARDMAAFLYNLR
ncbi:MAG: c-type cytochrome [Chloroflexi bacterium]|nr:c-type cytochrome [Chloroflexota bacterium]MBP8054773.1 c-type cytochrome [Chloroflexota bacterium]